MFCILVFVIFLILYPILGIFSKKYRIMFKKAWSCAFKKVMLKPCDVNFGQEIKSKLLGKIAFRFPRIARFIDKTATFWAFAFIAFSLWSLLYAARSGLNLWVYDTCNPTNGESCALSGEACGVNSNKSPSIFDTISRIPDRLKNWDANDYTGEYSSYYNAFDNDKEVALEIIDPGCHYCKDLWSNIKEAGFENKYNLTYIAYPIPDGDSFKFQHSYLLASYLEALKIEPLTNNPKIPADWQLLNKIYTEDVEKTDLQNAINTLYSKEEVIDVVHGYLTEFGYTEEQITRIDELVDSDQVKNRISEQVKVVEDEIQTIKIPTIMFNGNRYDRVISVDKLKNK